MFLCELTILMSFLMKYMYVIFFSLMYQCISSYWNLKSIVFQLVLSIWLSLKIVSTQQPVGSYPFGIWLLVALYRWEVKMLITFFLLGNLLAWQIAHNHKYLSYCRKWENISESFILNGLFSKLGSTNIFKFITTWNVFKKVLCVLHTN